MMGKVVIGLTRQSQTFYNKENQFELLSAELTSKDKK